MPNVEFDAMAERMGAWARATGAGTLWGIGVAWWYDAPLAKGAFVGTILWGCALFLALRGPYAPELS